MITIRRTRTAIIIGASVIAVVVFLSFFSAPADAATLEPKNIVTAPTIDGTRESAWDSHYLYTATIPDVLKIYACVFNDFVYFGLEYKVSTHDSLESFAIACANVGSVGSSILNYTTIKVVCFNKKSWDLVVNGTNVRNYTSNVNLIGFNVKTIESNHTFYELRFPRQPSRANNQPDVNWARSGEYALRIYYGTTYANQTELNYPLVKDWTLGTGQITIKIPVAPTDPTSPEVKAGEFNTLVTKIVLFIIAGFGLGVIGLYIMRTKSKIKRA